MNRRISEVPLSQVCILNMGQSPSSDSYNENKDGLPFFQGNADFGDLYPTERIWCNQPSKIAHKGDILLSVRAPIGALNLAKEECCIGRGLAALSPIPSQCRLMYLYYALKSKVKILEQQGTGSTFKAVGKDKISALQIPLYGLEEQERIIGELMCLEAGIGNVHKQLAKLDTLVKSRFIEMFGDYIDDTSKQRKLREVCDFIDYRGKTPEKSDFGIPLITAKNVRDNHFSQEPQEFIPKENYEAVMTRGIPKVNDVLFTTEAPLGNVCRIPNLYDKFCVGQRIVTMQPHVDALIPEYLERTLLSDDFQKKIWQQATGSTVKGIRSKRLIELTIPVPPLNLQKSYADFVALADKSKLTIQKSIEALQTLKAKLMQEYFG